MKNKIKSLFTITLMLAFHCCLQHHAAAQLPTGLVAHYPFDNGNATDASGHGYNGAQLNGVSSVADRFNKPNRALGLDGLNDYVLLPTTVMNNLTQGTFIATVYLNSYSTNGSPIISQADPTLTDFMVAVNPNGRLESPWISVEQPQSLIGSHVIPLRTWVQVAMTWDGTYWKQYVDGQLDYQFESSATPRPSSRPVEIGYHEHCCVPVYFDGRIDEVRIYNRALTIPEIEQLHIKSSLVAYYPFDGGSGTDLSGNGFHGTPTNGVAPVTDRFSNANSALNFNGVSGFVLLPSSVMNNLTQGTFVASIQIPSYHPVGAPIISQADPILTDFMVALNPIGKVESPWITVAMPQFLTGNNTVPLQKWTHVVFTWDGSFWRQYVNGQLDYQYASSASPRPSARPVELGYHEHCCVPIYFEGKMDEVQIYNRALSVSEVTQVYAVDSRRPFLNLTRAVRLDHLYLSQGTNYQLQVSSDLNSWRDFGSPFSSSSSMYSQYVDVGNSAAYFRLVDAQ